MKHISKSAIKQTINHLQKNSHCNALLPPLVYIYMTYDFTRVNTVQFVWACKKEFKSPQVMYCSLWKIS